MRTFSELVRDAYHSALNVYITMPRGDLYKRPWYEHWLDTVPLHDIGMINGISIFLHYLMAPFTLALKIPAKFVEVVFKVLENFFEDVANEFDEQELTLKKVPYLFFIALHHLFGMTASLVRYTLSLKLFDSGHECRAESSRSGKILGEGGLLLGMVLSLIGIVGLFSLSGGLVAFLATIPALSTVIGAIQASLNIAPFFSLIPAGVNHITWYMDVRLFYPAPAPGFMRGPRGTIIPIPQSAEEKRVNNYRYIKALPNGQPNFLTATELDKYETYLATLPDEKSGNEKKAQLAVYKKLRDEDCSYTTCNITKEFTTDPITIKYSNTSHLVLDKKSYLNAHLQGTDPNESEEKRAAAASQGDYLTRRKLENLDTTKIVSGYPSLFVDEETGKSFDFEFAPFLDDVRHDLEVFELEEKNVTNLNQRVPTSSGGELLPLLGMFSPPPVPDQDVILTRREQIAHAAEQRAALRKS